MAGARFSTGQCARLEGRAQRASVHGPDQDGGGLPRGRLSRCGQLAAQPLRWRPAWSPLGWVLVVVRPDKGCLTLRARSSSHCRHGHSHGHSHPHRPAADSSSGRLAASRAAPSASFSSVQAPRNAASGCLAGLAARAAGRRVPRGVRLGKGVRLGNSQLVGRCRRPGWWTAAHDGAAEGLAVRTPAHRPISGRRSAGCAGWRYPARRCPFECSRGTYRRSVNST
jgi:hypothetical protein